VAVDNGVTERGIHLSTPRQKTTPAGWHAHAQIHTHTHTHVPHYGIVLFDRSVLRRSESPEQALFPATCCTSKTDACGKPLEHFKAPIRAAASSNGCHHCTHGTTLWTTPHLVFAHAFVWASLAVYPLRIKHGWVFISHLGKQHKKRRRYDGVSVADD